MVRFWILAAVAATVAFQAGAAFGQATPTLGSEEGNLIARVPAGRSFSISCPDSNAPAVVECSGTGVEVVDGVCVPLAAYATADSVAALSTRVDATVVGIQNISTQMQRSGGPPNVLVVAIQVTENCTFGDCLVTVVTKPMINAVALVQGVAIYRCRFTSALLSSPVVTDAAASSDGFTVGCAVPVGTYPAGVAAGSLEMSVELLEGAVSGNAGNVIPWGHGATGELAVDSMTFIKHPGAPRVGMEPTGTVFSYMLDQSNTFVIRFTVVDVDTAAADVTVSLQTTLQATVARLGNTNDYTLTISNVNNGQARYTSDIVVIATDNVGQSGNATVRFNFISNVVAEMMPPGATVQTTSQFQNALYDISVPSYSNNINNFRPTTMAMSFTTARTNSKVFVQTQFTMAAHSISHVYVDIWRRVGSGPFQSLSRLLGGNDADGLMSEHAPGRTGATYEQGKWPMVMDEPNVAAGTRLEYKVYVGLWSGSTVTFGSHRNGNNNGRSPEHFIIEEIAVGNCNVGGNVVPCVNPTVLPLGSPVQSVSSWQNLQYDINVPHYNNNINNLRPTQIRAQITTTLSSSKIMVQTQFNIACHSGSHVYVDIWRKIGDGNFQSLSRLIGGSSADALISEHPSSSTGGWYEQAKWPMVLDTPQVPAGTVIEYKIYVGSWGAATITIGSFRNANNNGNSPEHLVMREIKAVQPSGIAILPVSVMPAGSIVNTGYQMQNLQYDVNVPHYGNNINNFRPTRIYYGLTTVRANSKIFVRSNLVLAPHSNSHVYVDIWRKIESGSYVSLSRLYGGSAADGMMSEHPAGGSGGQYEQANYPFVLDNPRVAAGTRIEYKIYVGGWGGQTITIGSHRNGNNNGNSPEQFLLQEVLV